ncbi:hypothetical protein [Egicoccus sp. AB-alg2]|uniref:hypothetical protein n=1 Tax=Egicoccus sp. AB-alg2 TaxID=3242693 RepID=UPI00359EDF72
MNTTEAAQELRRRCLANHPSNTPTGRDHDAEFGAEDGSLVTEYGLIAIVAATIASAVITWASGGAIATLFNALLRAARGTVGA